MTWFKNKTASDSATGTAAPKMTVPPAAEPTAGLTRTGAGKASMWSRMSSTSRMVVSFVGVLLVAMAAAHFFDASAPVTPVSRNVTTPEANLVLANRRDASLGGIAGLSQRVDELQRQQEGIVTGIQAIKEMQTQQGLNTGGTQPFMAEEMAAQINALKEELERLKTKPPGTPGDAALATPPALNTPIGAPPTLPDKIEPPAPPKMRIVGESSRVDVSLEAPKESEFETLLAGGTFEGVLLNGMDAPTSAVTEKNPVPVLIRVKTDAILPNLYQAGVRECFVIAAGYGVLATERAQLRTETISCVRPDGRPIETKLDAYVVGEDGKVGMRGRLVSKQGQVIAQSLAAGFLEGIARGAVPQQVPQLNINPGGTPQTQNQDFSGVMRNGALGGVSAAASQISKFYLDMAQQMFPVVEIDAGRRVSITTLKGMQLSALN